MVLTTYLQSLSLCAGAVVPIYSDWKTDWEEMMENFNERCDNCIYAMRNIESEEIRNDKWFRKADDKKKNILAGVLGMEYFLYETEVRFYLHFRHSIGVLKSIYTIVILQECKVYLHYYHSAGV